MKEIVGVLATANGHRAERLAAHRAFLQSAPRSGKTSRRADFPSRTSRPATRSLLEPPRRTAIRCDFLLASKIALGPKYQKDRIADQAQREAQIEAAREA
jgi:hypothetical protein